MALRTVSSSSKATDWRFSELTRSRLQASFLAKGATQLSIPAQSNIFRQGEPADAVHYIVEGQVHISVTSSQGKEGMIALPVRAGDFIGEISLTKQPSYLASANTTTDCVIMKVPRGTMSALLKSDIAVGQAFTAFMLRHDLDIEAELVDHLFNSSEKRLARTLLLLANFERGGQAAHRSRT